MPFGLQASLDNEAKLSPSDERFVLIIEILILSTDGD